ncbi:hypothetical protein [Sphingomonas crocodyli]|uniref:HTH tetR-type domain-containing protein n=1 Tax=Sphingomonas crocodyli TaxID=1979270 RepID=A0A437M6A6_9SPHN|nr:hypothetical protein [Sphingomonas crocodyli]RVT93179.1 hypothetical protein EOD43_04635 [Sphingomonas crocodyli]
MLKPAARPAGRPRRLTLERVLDEAWAMGIDNIEMAPLARRLGVAVGTLYSYVNNREHLIFQVASRRAQAMVVKDVGQEWQDIIREHAALTFERMRGWPQLIANLVSGNAGTHFGAETRRVIVDLLHTRGLSKRMANDLYFETNQTVLGAVVATQFMETTLVPLAEGRSSAEAFGIPAGFGSYEPALERMIACYEGLLAG